MTLAKFIPAGVAITLTLLAPGASLGTNTNPGIQIARGTNTVLLTFSGALESAEAFTGPWAPVTNSSSPYLAETTGNQRFFRTVQPETNSIFSSRAVIQLTLTGPLQQHFDLAFAGTPDGIFPPVRQKPYFDATVAVQGVGVPAKVRVRGNSSLQECPFPKLKMKVSSEDRPGTPFFDAREIKIGTHCAEGGRGNIGRLRDERAAFREALAYEVMTEMGFISPRVRRARIEYRDTTPPPVVDPAGEVGSGDPVEGPQWPITRAAALFDDIEVVAERLGGRALSEEEVQALTKAGFDAQLVTELELLHALLGNWDFKLSPDGQGLWNTEVIQLPNQQLLPVAGDFDLASFVTGRVRLSAPHEYHPELADVERQSLYDVEAVQARSTPELFAEAVERYAQKRLAVEELIEAAVLDEEGRTNALRHVTAFFDALNKLKR